MSRGLEKVVETRHLEFLWRVLRNGKTANQQGETSGDSSGYSRERVSEFRCAEEPQLTL